MKNGFKNPKFQKSMLRKIKVHLLYLQMSDSIVNNLVEQFARDPQGRRFSDVQNDGRIDFKSVLNFFDDEKRQIRLEESEEHHLRPALAGVIRELEQQQQVADFLGQNDGHTTVRFRQAVGVVVRIIMENRGWETTRRKGSLGTRNKVAAGTTTPGAYENEGGLSRWFVRAERYRRSHPSA